MAVNTLSTNYCHGKTLSVNSALSLCSPYFSETVALHKGTNETLCSYAVSSQNFSAQPLRNKLIIVKMFEAFNRLNVLVGVYNANALKSACLVCESCAHAQYPGYSRCAGTIHCNVYNAFKCNELAQLARDTFHKSKRNAVIKLQF